MKNLLLASVTLVACTATRVAAWEISPGLTLTGDVELEYVSSELSDDSQFGFTDLTLSWRSQAGAALTFGVDVSVVSIHDLDFGNDTSALWAGLVIGTAIGEFQVGRPRPLHDTMFNTPDIGASRASSELSNGYNQSIAGTLVTESDGGANPLGITFRGQMGSLSYGAAYHRIAENSERADVIELVANYDIGPWSVYGGIEVIDTSSADFEKVILGGKYMAENWSVGAQYADVSFGPIRGQTIKLYGDYMIVDGLTLGIQFVDMEIPLPAKLYGLSGTYAFGSGGFVELGIVNFETSFFGTLTSGTASVGFKF